jgi:ribulose-phosphate 3-epimerase
MNSKSFCIESIYLKRMSKIKVAPSVLSADFLQLGKDIDMLNRSAAEWIHIDVMDGIFVPNISFGFPVLSAIRKQTTKVCDVHLMIDRPERYFRQFKDAGADNITIHYEGNLHLDSMLNQIKALGCTTGVALNPATPVSVLKEVVHLIDVILIMSVNPGFGGQKFIPYTVEKVKEAVALIKEKGTKTLVQVDGGVNLENARVLATAGAAVLVAGNAVFGTPDPLETIQKLSSLEYNK